MFSPELKKGSIEFLILTLLAEGENHGYEIGKQIESRSRGKLTFRVSSLYPVLYRMENRGWITSRWVEKEGERRRNFYRLTQKGEKILVEQLQNWAEFTEAIGLIIDPRSA